MALCVWNDAELPDACTDDVMQGLERPSAFGTVGLQRVIFAPPVPGSGQASQAQYLWEDLDDPVRKNDVSSAEALTGSSGKEYLFVPGDIVRVLVTVALPTDSFNLN